ncbi:MAG: hypothetical protein ACREAA_16805 [Candidatus Polarisedimenticolia bacterium]
MFGAVFTGLALMMMAVRPQDVDPGEGPAVAARTGLLVGFVSGAIFGAILSLAEHGKMLVDLALLRVAFWGVLAAAVWPLSTEVHDSMVIILCPLGGLFAAAAVALARRPGMMGRLLARPLQAACASRG